MTIDKTFINSNNKVSSIYKVLVVSYNGKLKIFSSRTQRSLIYDESLRMFIGSGKNGLVKIPYPTIELPKRDSDNEIYTINSKVGTIRDVIDIWED